MYKIVFQNKWITIKSFRDDELGVKDFYVTHETRSGGHSVAILPFRKIPNGYEFLLKGDIIPAWHKKIELCSITGAVEFGKTPEKAAVMEIDEEVGYTISEDDLVSLGTCYGHKASTTTNHLFTVDLTDKEWHEPEGDGYEKLLGNESHWVTDGFDTIKDPLVPILYVRLLTYLQK